MALWQEGMIRLARSEAVAGFAQKQHWLSGLAGQFVSGPTVHDAVVQAERLSWQGIDTSMFFLGEYVTDPGLIAQTVGQLTSAISAAAEASLNACASVDPTQVGLMIDEATCRANARRLANAVLAAAPEPRPGRDALMIDMEDAAVTQPTLDLYWALRDEGLPVAVTVQAYLHRTRDDLDALVGDGAWVRLVKGAFAEPTSDAVRTAAERDSRFRQCASVLLSRAAQQSGVYPAFGTHDHRAIEEIITQADAQGWARDGYEFEMLYGVRPDLQRELVARGHRVRLYLPFGADWFPYAIRRVGESPRNLRFVATALAKRFAPAGR